MIRRISPDVSEIPFATRLAGGHQLGIGSIERNLYGFLAPFLGGAIEPPGGDPQVVPRLVAELPGRVREIAESRRLRGTIQGFSILIPLSRLIDLARLLMPSIVDGRTDFSDMPFSSPYRSVAHQPPPELERHGKVIIAAALLAASLLVGGRLLPWSLTVFLLRFRPKGKHMAWDSRRALSALRPYQSPRYNPRARSGGHGRYSSARRPTGHDSHGTRCRPHRRPVRR